MLIALMGCVVIALGGGCSQKDAKFEIRGRVSFEGEPISDGKILFMPKDESRPQAISKIANGEYVTASPGGVYVGGYNVQVFGYRGTGKIQDLGEMFGKQEQQEQYVPAKFNRATELTVDITADKTEYDFDL